MKKIYVRNADCEILKLDRSQTYELKHEMGLKAGELISVSDGEKENIFIIDILKDEMTVLKFCYRHVTSEPDIFVTLYLGIPTDNKLEAIIRSTVELGVARIVPVETKRSVKISEIEDIDVKYEIYSKIIEKTAKESGREIIPEISRIMTLREAVEKCSEEKILLFYELGGTSLQNFVGGKNKYKSLAMFIGPEGGFDKDEADFIASKGGNPVTLGPRILRCETASVAALSAIMTLSGNLQ